MLQLKADAPNLLMYQTDPTTNERVYFGHNPDSTFKDERVRIAYFKCIDRDAYVTAAHNTDGFEKAGLPVQTFWESPSTSRRGRATSSTRRARQGVRRQGEELPVSTSPKPRS